MKKKIAGTVGSYRLFESSNAKEKIQMSANRLQNQFVVRNFKIDTDVLPLIHLRKQLGEAINEVALRAEFAWRNQDPEQDRWVVEAADNPGVLLGHGFGFHTIP